MSFTEQAAKVFDGMAEFKFQAVLFGRDAVYLEGAAPIKLDADEMILKARGCVITVTGGGLAVKELDGDCVSIVGRIDGISVRDL